MPAVWGTEISVQKSQEGFRIRRSKSQKELVLNFETKRNTRHNAHALYPGHGNSKRTKHRIGIVGPLEGKRNEEEQELITKKERTIIERTTTIWKRGPC